MKKDWTDILAEKLREAEESLPKDSWTAVQLKYSARKSRKRKAMIAWLGAGLSAAAVVLLAMILFTTERTIVPATQITQNGGELAVDLSKGEVSDERASVPQNSRVVKKSIAVSEDILGREEKAVEVEEKISSEKESPVEKKTPVEDETGSTSKEPFDRYPLMDIDPVFEFENGRKPFKASFSISGTGTLAGTSLGLRYDEAPPAPEFPGDNPSSPGDGLPIDTIRIHRSRLQHVYWQRHSIPVTFAVSGKFDITETFSLSANLQYSMYKSAFRYSEYDSQTRYQYAHYLGLGLRADFNIVSRKHFCLYAGIGAQTDRCFYALADGKRIDISRQSWLWSMNVVLGVEYRINELLGIYLEPVFSANFNEPDLESYRTGKTLMFSGCIGLRFNL